MLAVSLLGVPESRAQRQDEPAQKEKEKETTPRRGATRDAVTEKELVKRLESAPKLGDLLKPHARPRLPGAPKPLPKPSPLSRFIILFDGEKHTLIPLGSILHLPVAHRARVVAKPRGPFTVWPKFLKRNVGWLSAKEVPLAMAKGDTKAAESVLREVATDDHAVVSVYKGGPISILEPASAASEVGDASKSDDKKQ